MKSKKPKELISTKTVRKIVKENYKPQVLTEEQLKKWFNKILNLPSKVKERDMVLWQGCLDQGGVERSSVNLNLCSNPNCVSCRMYDNALKEEVKKFTNKTN